MKRQQILIGTLVLGLLLVLAVGLSLAQEPEPPEGEIGMEGEIGVAAVSSRIPVQGRLTNAGGSPLNGTYSIRFSLYAAATGGTALCSDTNSVSVEDGLFYSEIWGSCGTDDINGQQLYLGIEVEGDGEMMPRQPILPVPYAFSLIPGAIISDTRDGVLTVRSTGSGYNDALLAYAEGTGKAVTGAATDGIGVYGTSVNSDGVQGYSLDDDGVVGISINGDGVVGATLSGTGVVGLSGTGTAISAEGTGIIQSTAKSYVWISGNGVRPYSQSDSTVIDLDSIGGAIVTPGATASARYVMLPVTVPGPLYGQDMTISDLDIYWVGDTDMDAITDIRFRRQTGVCDSCYAEILHDATDHTCYEDTHPTGCTIHYDLTSNNVLTADSGVLYMMLQLTAIGNDTWIRIGGVRLTLEHD